MAPRYFDIHSHIQFPQFDADKGDVVRRMEEKGVWALVVGVDLESSRRALEEVRGREGFFATAGLHPNDVLKEDFDEREFGKLAREESVVAIGECGLDYFRTKPEKEAVRAQKEVFEKHVDIAVSSGKPLMIHCRNAHGDIIDILSSRKREHGDVLRGNIHFFTGTTDDARRYFELDFTVSFTGVLTFTHDYDDVVRYAPLRNIMSETDCPFAAPVPYRGRRNEPAYVVEVVRKIADIRGEDVEAVRAALAENPLRMFGIRERMRG